MKVLPVSYGINNFNIIKSNSNSREVFRRVISANTNTTDSVSFAGYRPLSFKQISTMSELKSLAKGGHQCCIWCGGRMFHPEELETFQYISKRLAKNSELFSRVMLHFQDYLPPEYVKLIKKISAYSVATPEQSLKSILQKMLPEAQSKLERKQFLIFHKMKNLRPELPEEAQKEFDILLENSKCRVFGISHVEEFSAKEFCYQLHNLVKKLPTNVPKQKIIETGSILTHPALKENSAINIQHFFETFYRQLKINPRSNGNYISPKDPYWRNKAKLLVIKLINEMGKETGKSGKKEIEELCNRASNMVLQKPTIIPFSNKAFGYKLNEILERVNNKNLQEKFNSMDFPSSTSDMNAFIVKNKNISEETWIYKLLKSSEVTLEHIVPILRNTTISQLRKSNKPHNVASRTRKGENNLGNWALAHAWCNVKHGSENIKGDNFPFSKEAGVKYFQTMIEDANKGRLAGETVIQMARNYFFETGIKINLKGLKYSSEY